METTFQKRGPISAWTQRQWSDLAILRTTPALLRVVLLGDGLGESDGPLTYRCCIEPPANRRMVRQARPDFQRCHRRRSTRSLVSAKFMHVSANQGDHRNPCNHAAKIHRDSLSCCVKRRKVELRRPHLSTRGRPKSCGNGTWISTGEVMFKEQSRRDFPKLRRMAEHDPGAKQPSRTLAWAVLSWRRLRHEPSCGNRKFRA